MSNLQQNRGCLGFLTTLFGGRGSNQNASSDTYPYRLRDDFLSPAERSFYGVLQHVVDRRAVICPKVNLSDVLFVSRPHENRAARNRIDRKHVDFLLCDPATMQPLAGVELDDRSHTKASRQERDRFVDAAFSAASLPLLRFPARTSYVASDIAEAVSPLFDAGPQATAPQTQTARSTTGDPPRCPKCDEPMVQRTTSRGERAGQMFWGCTNFPRCRQVIQIDGGVTESA